MKHTLLSLFCLVALLRPGLAGTTVIQYGFDFTSGTVQANGGTVTNDAGDFYHAYNIGNGGTYSADLPPLRRFTTGVGSLLFGGGVIVCNPDTNAGSLEPNFTNIISNGGLTMEIWVKGNASTDLNVIMASQNYVLYSTATGARWANHYSNNGVNAAFDRTVWHHLAGVLYNPVMTDGNLRADMRFYVDGVLAGTFTGSVWGSDSTPRVGVGTHPVYSIYSGFRGLVYEPRVTLGVLTPGMFTTFPAVPPAPAPGIAVEQPGGTGLVNGSGSVNFGTVLAGASVRKTFLLLNTGNVALTGLTVSRGGAHATDFTISPVNPSLPHGVNILFEVAFTPSAGGDRTATLSITHSIPGGSPFSIALGGIGAGAPPREYSTGPGNGADGSLIVAGPVAAGNLRAALARSATAGSPVLEVSTVSGFSAGQRIGIIQMRGIKAGQVEEAVIASVSAGTLVLQQPLRQTYPVSATDAAQVLVIPQYTDVTILPGGTLSCPAWDGMAAPAACFGSRWPVSCRTTGWWIFPGKASPGAPGAMAGPGAREGPGVRGRRRIHFRANQFQRSQAGTLAGAERASARVLTQALPGADGEPLVPPAWSPTAVPWPAPRGHFPRCCSAQVAMAAVAAQEVTDQAEAEAEADLLVAAREDRRRKVQHREVRALREASAEPGAWEAAAAAWSASRPINSQEPASSP